MTNRPKIEIVDSHHKALSAWAAFRNTLSLPPRLITLDHHTDTSKAFRRLISIIHGKSISLDRFHEIQNSYLNAIDFRTPETVDEAISKLNNDEHIIAAIKSNIISSAFVVAHNATNTNLKTYFEHRIVCHTVNEVDSSNGQPQIDYDRVLDSMFLEQVFAAFDKILSQAKEEPLLASPYILDIDLDYFNTFKSIEPEDAERFKSLAKHAQLVTIATEPEYVQSCAVDAGLTSEFLLKKLLELVK